VEYLQQKNLYVQALQQVHTGEIFKDAVSENYNFYKGIPVTE